MNTRLQVEHPVTEQVRRRRSRSRAAAGRGRPAAAVASRISCGSGAMRSSVASTPSIPPKAFCRSRARCCSIASRQGRAFAWTAAFGKATTIPVHYDPLVAKLIVSAESRALALRAPRPALSEFAVLGIHTNVPFLRALVNHPEVRAGRLDTRFIERTLDELVADMPRRCAARQKSRRQRSWRRAHRHRRARAPSSGRIPGAR